MLAFSLLFYAWGEGVYILVLCGSILLNYFCGIFIERSLGKNLSLSKFILAGGIIANLLTLGYFKYANFFFENVSNLFGIKFEFAHIVLPIGISFFTFQCIAYLIDVFKKNHCASKNLINFALYISMFPQLVAGPIVRYNMVAEQLEHRVVSLNDIALGAERFLIGFAKKIIIANVAGEVVDSIFALDYANTSSSVLLVGLLFYSIQLYFDFSAYSDMAIGLGRVFGFSIPENFNYPLIASSIQDFWHRWHLTLSSWFRDYLYFPLGGSKKGLFRTYLNLMIVFVLCGLWHGANWTYVVWGLYNGVFLVLEKLSCVKNFMEKMPKFMRHVYALFVLHLSWPIFRCDSISDSWLYIKSLFAFQTFEVPSKIKMMTFDNSYIIVFVIGVIFCTPIYRILHDKYSNSVIFVNLVRLALLVIFFICIGRLATDSYNPFIYFKF